MQNSLVGNIQIQKDVLSNRITYDNELDYNFKISICDIDLSE